MELGKLYTYTLYFTIMKLGKLYTYIFVLCNYERDRITTVLKTLIDESVFFQHNLSSYCNAIS